MKKPTPGRGEEGDASGAPLQPPVRLQVPPPTSRSEGGGLEDAPAVPGGVNAGGLSPPLRDVPRSPGGQRRPTSPERKQEIPPRWGTEPEVPPSHG